jgi:DNA repair photolyase
MAVPNRTATSPVVLVRMKIRTTLAKTILTKTSGFIAEAGFTHSLTPARNCTFGCTYCYVPTMRIYGGLKPEDWQHWGQFTTFKSNAADLLGRELRPEQRIYCSPLVDPYQPSEASEKMMPRILEALLEAPPRVFTIQTRGSLILRDLELLKLAKVRVSFSITTNRDDIRRLYEPHCSTFEQRLDVVRTLRDAGIETYATLAPLLPCDPELLARAALDATHRDLIGDPLHIRATKPHGATTREAAFKIAARHHHSDWLNPQNQATVVEQIDRIARAAGFSFTTGPEGFARLAL